MSLRNDADIIIKKLIEKILPDQAVKEALRDKEFGDGRIFAVSIGKAEWQIAKVAAEGIAHPKIKIAGSQQNDGFPF